MDDKVLVNCKALESNIPDTCEFYPTESDTEYSIDAMSRKPVIYLDFDGVINFFNSRTNYQKNNETFGYIKRDTVFVNFVEGLRNDGFQINWSSELLRKLSELDVEIVWLSTWREHTELLEEAMNWGKPINFLHWGEFGGWSNNANYGNSSSKLEAVISDQTMFPRPFIWIDDEAIVHYDKKPERAAILKRCSPHLTIRPNEKYGIVKPEYKKIVDFLDYLQSIN